jgi:hypothetical protein
VRGVDIKHHEFAEASITQMTQIEGEKSMKSVQSVVMGCISVAECEVLCNNALVNIHMAHTAATMGVPRYFFSSSMCVYWHTQPGELTLTEEEGKWRGEDGNLKAPSSVLHLPFSTHLCRKASPRGLTLKGGGGRGRSCD